ncbi:MAG TPA: hypothetical protein VME19_10930 [Streptosporangiaceae bacterium]|nr:hypothetical protein [Streptosporangiaceae bacterium]
MDSWRRAEVPVLPGSGPAPWLHDTATGTLVPAAAGPVATLYACGITPYDATHIGHAATYTAWDLLVRAWLDATPAEPERIDAWRWTAPATPVAPPASRPTEPPTPVAPPASRQTEPPTPVAPPASRPTEPPNPIAPPAPSAPRFTVVYVQNVTDVDDPLLERADRDGEDWRELARRETQRYRGDMETLRVLPPTHLVGAVEALPVIERYAARIAERGALYDVDEDVYFARSADPEFGALSGPGTPSGFGLGEMADLFAQRGGDPARPGKKDPLDFLVWRAERPGEPAWDSPWGRGRPGWHVECAAIAAEYLGPVFDVQAGGSDLVFPHHEMSASHARVAFAPEPRVFARVYAHAGMVSYQGQKMSKSLGNLVFVSRLVADGVDPMAVRMALLAHHYRSDWEWTDAVLGEAQARLARWRAALAHAEAITTEVLTADPSPAAELVLAGVRARLRDDLDAPGALTVVDHWADTLLAEAPGLTAADGSGARLVRDTVDALLGVSL